MERRNAWLSYTEAEEKELEQVAKAYRNFLNVGKTERECVTQIIREARAAGYESLEEKTAKGEKLKAGDKVYTVGMKKIIALFHIGQDDISEGMNILGAHIDSPRLDVWISNRIHYMRIRILHIWIPIIMAVLRNTSG